MTALNGLGDVILASTREPSMQIFDVLLSVAARHHMSAGLVIAGKDFEGDKDHVGPTTIIVGTQRRFLLAQRPKQQTTTTASTSPTAATAKTTAEKKPSKLTKLSRPTNQPYRAQANADGGNNEDSDKRNGKHLDKLLAIKRQRTASSSANTTQPMS